MEIRTRKRSSMMALRLGLFLATLGGTHAASAGGPKEDRWSIVLSTAPGIPQDVWIAANGSNEAGWMGGGSVCLGVLAEGFPEGQHATLLTDVVEAGLIGVDGTPVAPGTYEAPGGRPFEIETGQTFYMIVDVLVVNSNTPDFVVGSTFQVMFTFDYEEGRSEQPVVAWFNIPGVGWVPFRDEGVMMTNVRRHP